MLKVFLITSASLLVVALAAFLFVSYQTSFSHGPNTTEQVIQIARGENVLMVGEKLEAKNIVSSRWYFAYYFWKESLRGKTIAGEYLLGGQLTIPEIAHILTGGNVRRTAVSVTFPEGWDSRKIAERLKANALPGDTFLTLVEKPDPAWRTEFPYLQNMPGTPDSASLEGFLFPDTYLFRREATADEIARKMLDNFGRKWNEERQAALATSGKELLEVVTLASIVENEVPKAEDRKLVADLFWRRLADGQRLESDATIKYILGENKIQHSFEETRTESPYNTYIHEGLPPGPIGNPGLEALDAALHPTANAYLFFLSHPDTGETFFAKTFEEHKANKTRSGL